MFYYFIPRCEVEGYLVLEGEREPLKSSSGWYDHEFGQHGSEQTEQEEEQIAWNWISAQLNNGWELSAYDLFNTDRGESAGRWAIAIDPAGNRHHYTDFMLEPLADWRSIRTFNNYPVRWRLKIPEADINLEVEAAFAEQEFITVISSPAFWEGRVNVAGTMNGQPISGAGYVERSGYDNIATIKDFFAAVGGETQRAVRLLLPLEPTPDDALQLIGSKQTPHYVDGIDIDQYTRTVIKPLRDIVDRGGKAWRSYALLACCDVVGGDSLRLNRWLAMPELFHVGSLIVDDVQDKSEIRRGGPACHMVYGEPLAINAGTAAYFLGQIFMSTTELTQVEQLRVYELYFETLRATHAGQAIDIDGLGAHMPHIVESGEGELLERRVLAIHRLKSAVPARALAMIGAMLGNGTEQQINALGDFFEALGLAFQIMDDVLNLRGFQGDLKSKGEDLAQGKVTMPVAKAMSRLQLDERRSVWKTIASKPTDPKVIGEIIEKFEACCALRSSEQHARDLVETAWRKLDPFIEDSYTKLRLRAFGWYVLERHY
jgi:geranylgeranyl pyrophosphate synthase